MCRCAPCRCVFVHACEEQLCNSHAIHGFEIGEFCTHLQRFVKLLPNATSGTNKAMKTLKLKLVYRACHAEGAWSAP